VATEAELAENLRGAAFMTASMAGFSSNDAVMKSLAADMSLIQATFLRGLIVTLLLAGLAWIQGVHRYWPVRRDRRLIAIRCAAEVGATITFLTALFHMPIANASAILQSVPLAVTLGAALFLAEPVGWRRYSAIAIGFVGVLVIVRPGSDGFTGYALWALGSIVFIVARDLVTRRLSPEAPGTTVALISSAALTLAAALALGAADWRPVGAGHLATLTLGSLCLLVGYVFSVQAMRTGEIGFVQPFRYTLLVWAMLFGILVFDERPDGWMLAGSAIVIATGLFTLYRERLGGMTSGG
jgi:drug/metabolite transporter (DMT)-like permease